MEVEGVVADTPCDGALFGGGGRLVGLALDAQIHDVVAANRAVVHYDVPRPQRNLQRETKSCMGSAKSEKDVKFS